MKRRIYHHQEYRAPATFGLFVIWLNNNHAGDLHRSDAMVGTLFESTPTKPWFAVVTGCPVCLPFGSNGPLFVGQAIFVIKCVEF